MPVFAELLREQLAASAGELTAVLTRMWGRCLSANPAFAMRAQSMTRSRIGAAVAAVGIVLSLAAAQAQQPNIVGQWKDTCNDGRVITVEEAAGGNFEGRYTKIGGLGVVHFTENEVGYQLEQRSPNKYVGEVKWRWTSGKTEWKPTTVTITGDKWEDTGSDRCSQVMTRIR
jgi:hypothetical protein